MAEPYRGMKDILFGYNEDISFKDGDLQTTTGIDFIEREIYKLLITDKNEWKLHPDIGANLEQFIGSPNTRSLGEAIENYLTQNLAATVYPGSLKIKVIPTGVDSIMIFIEIYVLNDVVSLKTFEFDIVNGFKRVPLDEQVSSKQSTAEYDILTSEKNKYWDRLRKRTTPRLGG